MGQSFIDYLNLLHAQGVTLEDAEKSGLVQNEQSLEWSLLLEARQGLKKDWEVESCKLGTGTNACIRDKVFSICVFLEIPLPRVTRKFGVADKGLFVWF